MNNFLFCKTKASNFCRFSFYTTDIYQTRKKWNLTHIKIYNPLGKWFLLFHVQKYILLQIVFIVYYNCKLFFIIQKTEDTTLPYRYTKKNPVQKKPLKSGVKKRTWFPVVNITMFGIIFKVFLMDHFSNDQLYFK